MNWEQLSREVARETGCDPDFGFSQDGQHPWVVAAIRIATLKEREACAKICDEIANATAPDDFALDAVNSAGNAIRMRSNAEVSGRPHHETEKE